MKVRWFVVFAASLLSALLIFSLNSATLLAQGETTYVVQSGDTLWRLAQRFGTTIEDLVVTNDIRDPDLIHVGQVLVVQAPKGGAPPSGSAGGPLMASWALVDWQPADPDYVAALEIQAQGGTLPYTYYHDGIAQDGAAFQIAWRRCRPKPGSVSVVDAVGATIKEDYWLEAPYCPVGVEILEPAEGAKLDHPQRQFNITWRHTVDPPPPAYGIEIEVWEEGHWLPWKTYEHERGDRELFFVPDEFPGDLGGRVRMWGIYGDKEAYDKTGWRTFSFHSQGK